MQDLPFTRFGPAAGFAILGTGAALPTDVDPSCPVLDTRGALAALGVAEVGGAEGWGVATRTWVGLPGEPGRVSVDALAAAAGRRALENAGLTRVDVVHVATSTPNLVSASLAAKVALRLDLGCATADVRAGGAGAILAWIEALGALRLGAKTALVVAVEVMSPYLPRGDATASLWGDGAGAVVLGLGDESLDVGFAGTTRVEGVSFTVPGPLPPTTDGSYAFRAPDAVYRDNLRRVRLDAAKSLREAAGALDVSLAYGATSAQVDELAAAIGAPAVSTLERTGCLGTAAILVALQDLRTRNARRPVRFGAVAAGGGVVWGALAWTMR